MSGFPIRPTRAAFGPKPKNARPVKNPAQEMDGPTIGDLLFWQVSGMGAVSPVAWLLVPLATVNGAVANVVHAESWNPNNDPAVVAPVVTRTAAGIHTVQYAATYADKDGIVQNTNLNFAQPIAQGLGVTAHFMHGFATKIDVRTFQVDLRRLDNQAADDVPFALLVW